jgi:Ca-activated chloride channel family protein
MLRFQHYEWIWFLSGILVLALVFFQLLQWKNSTTKKIGDKKLVDALVAGFSPGLFNLKFLLLIIAFAAGVFAAMNPRKPGGSDQEMRRGIDVVIALDVSKSMLATDLAPNRIDRAKQFIQKLVEKMPDDRIGLVLFAGKAYVQMPLTVDHGAAMMFVSSAGPDAVPQQGTVLGEAMEMSAKVFNAAERRFKSVVLISDGEDHDEGAVRTAKEMADEGVMINTVGIGSPEGGTIPEGPGGELKRDETGNVVVTRLNETVLQEIADATNGTYVRLQSSDEAVNQIHSQLAQIEKKAYGDTSQMNFKTFYIWLAGLMFVLLFAENFIPERRRKLA